MKKLIAVSIICVLVNAYPSFGENISVSDSLEIEKQFPQFGKKHVQNYYAKSDSLLKPFGKFSHKFKSPLLSPHSDILKVPVDFYIDPKITIAPINPDCDPDMCIPLKK